MRRITLLILTLTVLSLFAAGAVFGGHGRGVSINISHDGDDRVTTCADLNVRFDDERARMVSEEVPIGQVRSLKISNAYNGGIHVVGEGSAYSVTACKAASIPSEVGKIRVSVRDNEIVTDGPDNTDWAIFFLVRAPRNAVLDLSTKNGEISVRDLTGNVTARAKNGPVSLKNTSGTIDAKSVNGPVSIAGGSGTVKLSTTNGPLSVKLDSEWQGNMEGSTQNGPLSVRIPRGYRSGMIVESLGHGPISCRASACGEARRTWNDEDERRIEIGSATANVRLSTVNGPVAVKELD